MDTTVTTHEASTHEAPHAGEGNLFDELLSHVGDHHELDLVVTEVPLPYLFWDDAGFHYFSSTERVHEAGYTTSHNGKVLSKGGKPIGFDMSITTNVFFM